MKAISLASVLTSLILVLGSCQSLQPYAIDYLRPSQISFPKEYRKVGIVNATQQDDRRLRPQGQVPSDMDTDRHYRRTVFPLSDGWNLARSLAEDLAREHFFTDVVLLDSVVILPKGQAGRLSAQQATDLAAYLGTDLILAVEGMDLRRTDDVAPDANYGLIMGLTDVRIQPRVGIYYSGSRQTGISVQPTDSIYWRSPGTDMDFARKHLISQDELEAEASSHASGMILDCILPTWLTATRFYATGGSAEFRDAEILLKEGDWEGAASLWEKVYSRKNLKRKMYAALNLALGCEMRDEITQAIQWAEKARDHAYEVEKVSRFDGGLIPEQECPNFLLSKAYVAELQRRNEEIARLKAQEILKEED